MRKIGLLGTSALRSAVFIGAAIAIAAAPAQAQTPEEETRDQDTQQLDTEVEIESGQAVDETSGDNQEILVTGSRIRRPNLESTVPITSVGIQELTDTGDVSLGDALNDLPSLRSTYSQANSSRFIGTAGLNFLDLRGLGISRTLVLVNGRRHITGTPGDYLVDVNTIPTDLVERVDVVTGGNSAIYGSDAVAGVVNFVMKRDFEGLRIRGQGAVSDEADRGNYFVSLTGGQNFAEDRGNIAIALEYAKAEPLYFRERDSLTGAYSGRCQFNLAEPQGAAGGETGISATDNVPDNQFFCGVKNAGISNGGTIGTIQGGSGAIRFDRAGNLFTDRPSGVNFIPFGSGNWQGGQGSTLRDTGVLAAGLQRYSANLLARFEVSEALQPFLEAKYVHIDAIQEGQPSFWQGSIPGSFGGGSNLRCNNPFLTAQALATLQSFGLCTNVAAGTFTMSRFNVDFGGRGELHDRDTYRIVAGIEGNFNDDWRYEVAFNYGRLETKLRSLNNLRLFDLNGNPSGFLLALDAVRNAQGQIVCRVNADASTTNDDPACVPINVFGEGAPSQAALDYVNTTSTRIERAQEYVATAFVSGDSSQLVELPGGPVGFALGVEYRRETAFSEFDELVRSGGTFLNAIPTFDPPAFEVKEAFGEIRIPILRDMPFADELTIEAAGRVSDYKGATGTVFAYNLGGTWAPVSDLRFRANYSTSVRAPTQSDLFTSPTENFAQIADPCDVNNITNNANRTENCRAFGVPLTATAALVEACRGTASENLVFVGGPFINCLARAQTTGYVSAGNPALIEETGKSLTLGFVLTPRFIPGFSLTADYYDIEVEDLIAALGAQQIMNLCFDDPNGVTDNQYCASIQRDPASGLFVEPALVASGFNFARQRARGVDVEVGYRRTLGNGHRLNLRAIGTYVLERTNFTDPTNPEVPNRIKSELGDPVLTANLNLTYGMGPLDITYNLRYIGKQTIGTYEAQHSFRGVCTAAYVTAINCTLNEITTLPPQNADQYPQIYYPEVFYHAIRIGYKVNDQFSFYGGVDNLFDRKPPLGLLGTGAGDPFDPVGRMFYVGATVNFAGISDMFHR